MTEFGPHEMIRDQELIGVFSWWPGFPGKPQIDFDLDVEPKPGMSQVPIIGQRDLRRSTFT